MLAARNMTPEGGMSVRFSRRVTAVLAVPVLGALAILSATSAQPARAFPGDQLAHGEQVWNNVCSTCHGPDSTNNDAPLLMNPGTLVNYPNALEAVQYAIDNMPDDNPGSLPEQDYWDAMAFILTKQGIQVPDGPLNADNAASIILALP
jgi:mono/diheme cytochrome c family protein